MTWLLALAGLGLALYGLALFAAFTVATRVFARVRTSEAFTRVQESGAVRTGDALAARAVDAIPIGFARAFVKKRLPGDVSAYGLSMVEERLRDSKRMGALIAGGGFALFLASFWLGPRLTQAIAN